MVDEVPREASLDLVDGHCGVIGVHVVELVDDRLHDFTCGFFVLVVEKAGEHGVSICGLGDLIISTMLFELGVKNRVKRPVVLGLSVDLKHGSVVGRHRPRTLPDLVRYDHTDHDRPAFRMLGSIMADWKDLLLRARRLVKDHLPDRVVDAGERVLGEVVERAPAPIKDLIEGLREGQEHRQGSSAMTETERERKDEVLQRVKSKAEHGLKPEDRLVVVYTDDVESDAVQEIRHTLEDIESELRVMDLNKEPPQTRTQLAKLTGVMVPPYVYINGRYWGAQYELITLHEIGELEAVVANRLDELSEQAKKMGNVHEAYSEDLTVENILARWKLGHILCVDDLDAWYEVDKDGTEHFYYQGGPHPVEQMQDAAEEIIKGVADEAFEAHWQLEPSVHIVH